MKLRQRAQRVFETIREGSQQSIRRIAAATGLPKSSVHRHKQAIERRNQYPESALWETAAGGQWLQQQQKALGETQTAIEICAAADETAFERDVLVLMDLSSGYILVEEEVENRQYETWLDKAQSALTQVGVQVRSLVSDRAPALIKLALEGFECPSIADLLHPLWDLSKSFGAALSRQLNQVNQKLAQAQQRLARLTALAKDTTAQQQLVEQLQAHCGFVESGQRTYHRLRQQLTLAVHPFALSDGGFKTTFEIQAQLEQVLLKLATLQNQHQLTKADSALNKIRQQIPALAVGVKTWWYRVQHSLVLENLDAPLTNWLLGQMLPTGYNCSAYAKCVGVPKPEKILRLLLHPAPGSKIRTASFLAQTKTLG